MNLDLTDEETAALLRELDGLIDGDRYFMSPRIKTLPALDGHGFDEPTSRAGARTHAPSANRLGDPRRPNR